MDLLVHLIYGPQPGPQIALASAYVQIHFSKDSDSQGWNDEIILCLMELYKRDSNGTYFDG